MAGHSRVTQAAGVQLMGLGSAQKAGMTGPLSPCALSSGCFLSIQGVLVPRLWTTLPPHSIAQGLERHFLTEGALKSHCSDRIYGHGTFYLALDQTLGIQPAPLWPTSHSDNKQVNKYKRSGTHRIGREGAPSDRMARQSPLRCLSMPA